MLFKHFTYCMLICATLILLNMCNDQQWEYVILPIGVLIGGIYKLFDDDDRQYLMSQGIDPDNYEGWFPDLFPYNDDTYTQTQHHCTYNGQTTYNRKPYQQPSQNTYLFNDNKNIYKHIVKKCKRNVKINIDES